MCHTGWTTLFLAAHKNNDEVAKILCYSQANVDIRCEDGKTAVSVAVQTGKYIQRNLSSIWTSLGYSTGLKTSIYTLT
jgi:ankyrin repeat protein